MNFSLFFLASAAIVSTVSGTCYDIPAAAKFVILAKTGISTVPQSAVTGNIAVSPATSTAITGFSLTMDSSGEFSTSTQVTGSVYAPDYVGSALTPVVNDMMGAYEEAVGCATSDGDATTNLGAGNLGSLELSEGVYTFTTSVNIGGDLTFTGSETDVFIIQTTGNVLQTAATNMVLDGVLAKNILWLVAGSVTVNAGAHMEGIILGEKGVSFITGSSLNGSIFSQTAVTLQMATITQSPL